MKRLISIFIVITIISSLPLAIFADDEYRANIYRINDFMGYLTDEQVEELDDLCLSLVEENKIDLPLGIIDERPEEYATLQEYCDMFYEHNEFGYGDKKSGILLIIDTGNREMYIKAYGNGEDYLTRRSGDILLYKLKEWLNSDMSEYEVIKSYINAIDMMLTDYEGFLATLGADVEIPKTDPNTGEERPSWFPDDADSFLRFHNDADTPRVVDKADIFSDGQEAQMERMISDIQKKYGYDLVVCTDDEDYGMELKMYAADFFVFNGYGLGDEYSGAVLYICMDDSTRGFYLAATGEVEDMYTQRVVRGLNALLMPYMKEGSRNGNANGEYGEGAIKYIEEMGILYETGEIPTHRNYLVAVILAILLGVVGGGVVVVIEKEKMITVAEEKLANRYIVEGSFKSKKLSDILVSTRITKSKIERDSGSSGSGSSGYDSGYSSSSGTSFSGGGSRF